MAKDSKLKVGVIQVHNAETQQFPAVAENRYRELLAFAGIPEPSILRFSYKQVSVSPADTTDFSNEVSRTLTGRPNTPSTVIVLELDPDADADMCDLLCIDLFQALRGHHVSQLFCIAVTVADPTVFSDSVFVRDKLVPWCRSKDIGVILLSNQPGHNSQVLCTGQLLKDVTLPPLVAANKVRRSRAAAKPYMTGEQISGKVDLLFGHFAQQTDGGVSHVPVVASVRRLAWDPKFVRQLQDDVAEHLGDDQFAVLPFGVSSGGIQELAVALVQGAPERLLDSSLPNSPNSIVILCDIIGSMYPIADTVKRLKASGATRVLVSGIARLLDAPDSGTIEQHSYFQLPFTAAETKHGSCAYCIQESPLLTAVDFDGFARATGEFDPFTFWQFLGQDATYYSATHYPSERTQNHYQFLILADPIFRAWGFDIAIRIRNSLQAKGILPNWVNKIVIPEDPEAKLLAEVLARVLGLRADSDVVSIPRAALRSVAGQDISQEGVKLLDSLSIVGLKGKNVLVLDQAAHHLKTFSALRAICDHYGALVLAFAVFVDRTQHPLGGIEQLYGSHYVKLYSWPCPPKRDYECPCVPQIAEAK